MISSWKFHAHRHGVNPTTQRSGGQKMLIWISAFLKMSKFHCGFILLGTTGRLNKGVHYGVVCYSTKLAITEIIDIN